MKLSVTGDLWWKNAIVYCVDVETFYDGDGDGTGDFIGLTQQIDYLAGLGVTCIWLMPFYPTPNRDNGYDISDYYGIDPRLGTLGHFAEFVRTARERGIRIIADLVVNHTSDEHPWFKAARSSPDSPYRDFYVWADERPDGASRGLVFPGEEDSAWSYDTLARKYYLHRFYQHQPDLNIANDQVRAEISRVIGYWIELGLSGFRVDAAPFLIEQVGVENPAVSDPHDYLRDLRAFLSRRRGDAILLAEANEPPDRLGRFFGDQLGDQMHVLFNFIGNQSLYLALARRQAKPIERGLKRLPDAPPTAQWANFVRNHDELTLDRLTEAERREVFEAFAPEPSMRIYDRGIRRRLPPMVEGDRRRMELMYSLMLTMPGTPVLFYGEEIGMGDDQSQPGRDAVRTAMQWSAHRAAGFTTAPPDAVIRPPISGGPFGYERVNVDRQRRRNDSFLNWMERAIRTRKQWPEFGWGAWEIVPTSRPSVFALTSRWDGGQVVAVHNLSGRRARVNLSIESHDPLGWRHIFGSQNFDDPGPGPIELSIEGYGYHWYGARARSML